MTDYLSFQADMTDPEVASAYDDMSYWSSMFGRLLFRHLPLAPGLVCLDVGCGTGFPLLELADRLGPSATVHGLDAWDHAVERSRTKVRVRGNQNVTVHHENASDMPFADETFDLIVSNLGLNNFDDPPAVMAECRRVLKPGGRIALTTNLVGHMRELYEVYEQTLIATGHSDRVEQLRKQEAHRTTLDGLHQLFAGAGFAVAQCQQETFALRYADGSAFLRAYLTRVGFLGGWREALGEPASETKVFEELENRLNQKARDADGSLRLSIPSAYVEGVRKE